MAVAKRQRKEKARENGGKKKESRGLEWERQVKQTHLASPLCIGPAQEGEDKCIKGGSLEIMKLKDAYSLEGKLWPT